MPVYFRSRPLECYILLNLQTDLGWSLLTTRMLHPINLQTDLGWSLLNQFPLVCYCHLSIMIVQTNVSDWTSRLYLFVVVALAQASDIRIERRQVVFLRWMQDSNPRSHTPIARRLNARRQTNWAIEDQAKNLKSTARPYDRRAFSPFSWLSHLVLAIYMFFCC